MHALLQKSKPLVVPKIWKRDEIFTFLDIFEATFHASVSDPFESEDDMWKYIADKLLEKGITVSAQQCLSKWNFLYKTYISNQNRQGIFYAKVKQIVEFSQELNEQQESAQIVSNSEQVVEYGMSTLIKNENITQDEVQIEEVEECLNEHFEQSEETSSVNHDDQFTEIESLKPEKTDDIYVADSNNAGSKIQHDNCPEASIVTEIPHKKMKLSNDDLSACDQNDDQIAENNSSLQDILQTILSKINAIQEEQLTQKRKLDSIEQRQEEHFTILLDIKKQLDKR